MNERDDREDQRQILADGKFWLRSGFARGREWGQSVRQDADGN